MPGQSLKLYFSQTDLRNPKQIKVNTTEERYICIEPRETKNNFGKGSFLEQLQTDRCEKLKTIEEKKMGRRT